MNKIGVIGAGQMGRGICQVAAQSGCKVLLADMNIALAEKGRSQIATVLQKLVDKGKMTAADSAALIERITPVGDLEHLREVNMVVEAASEDATLKLDLFKRLDAHLPSEVILASNTSSISITKIAAQTKRPDKIIGMHFMNPVPLMKLVEVIRGVATSDATYNAVVQCAERFGKTVVTSNDYPGFIVNRILMPMINEAAYALMEGVASAADIDAAMKLGTNQPMGPLALADLIGLDTCLAILEVMHRDLGDSKYRPCPLLRRLVDAGYLGNKTGRGFFSVS